LNFEVGYIRHLKGDVMSFKTLWDDSIQESLRQKCRDAKKAALVAGHDDWFEKQAEDD
jgi:hypothetical protein